MEHIKELIIGVVIGLISFVLVTTEVVVTKYPFWGMVSTGALLGFVISIPYGIYMVKKHKESLVKLVTIIVVSSVVFDIVFALLSALFK